jgi:hypothetical protein
MPSSDTLFWLGLIASLLTAVATQADAFPPTWKPWLSLASVAGAAVTAYLLRSPRQS